VCVCARVPFVYKPSVKLNYIELYMFFDIGQLYKFVVVRSVRLALLFDGCTDSIVYIYYRSLYVLRSGSIYLNS